MYCISRGNSAKWSKLPFPCFYLVYSGACVIWMALFGYFLGSDYYSADPEHQDFITNLQEASLLSIGYACGAGTVFNIGNILLILAIRLVGLAVAFSVCVGISLIMGTLLTYMVQPASTDFTLLLIGLGLAVVALGSMALAHHFNNNQEDEEEELEAPILPKSKSLLDNRVYSVPQSLAICVACGLGTASLAHTLFL